MHVLHLCFLLVHALKHLIHGRQILHRRVHVVYLIISPLRIPRQRLRLLPVHSTVRPKRVVGAPRAAAVAVAASTVAALALTLALDDFPEPSFFIERRLRPHARADVQRARAIGRGLAFAPPRVIARHRRSSATPARVGMQISVNRRATRRRASTPDARRAPRTGAETRAKDEGHRSHESSALER